LPPIIFISSTSEPNRTFLLDTLADLVATREVTARTPDVPNTALTIPNPAGNGQLVLVTAIHGPGFEVRPWKPFWNSAELVFAADSASQPVTFCIDYIPAAEVAL
jgi:hypothetical protein